MSAIVFWTSVTAMVPLVAGILQQIILMVFHLGRLH
jgi:hypothetical protein